VNGRYAATSGRPDSLALLIAASRFRKPAAVPQVLRSRINEGQTLFNHRVKSESDADFASSGRKDE